MHTSAHQAGVGHRLCYVSAGANVSPDSMSNVYRTPVPVHHVRALVVCAREVGGHLDGGLKAG